MSEIKMDLATQLVYDLFVCFRFKLEAQGYNLTQHFECDLNEIILFDELT